MKLVNLTNKTVVLKSADGALTTVAPSGTVVRAVTSAAKEWPEISGDCPVPVFTAPAVSVVEGLPAPADKTLYIVTPVVAAHVRRSDVVCPGNDPQDETEHVCGAQDEHDGTFTRLVSSAN